MKGILAVAAREIRERRVLLLAGPVFGLLPVILPRLTAFARLTRDPEIALHLTGALLVGLPTSLALGLGASVLGRDIGERRLGFYFSRPLGGIEIWAGKILAVLAMLAISVALIPLPVLLLGDRDVVVAGLTPFLLGREGPPRWALPLFLTFVTAVAAAASVALRARSGLLVFDIAGAALVTGTIAWTVRTLVAEGAGPGISPSHPPVAITVVTLILLAATAAQVVAGRSDARRGHLALSSVAWGGLGLCAAGFFLYTQWVLGGQPRDLSRAWLSTPSQGESYVVSGRSTRGQFLASFLLDASGRNVERLSRGWSNLVWARDGSRLFWLVADGQELRTAWLGKSETGIASTALRLTAERQHYLSLQGVSADGRRVLASTGDVVLLLDPQSGTEIGSAPLSGWKRGAITAPDRARLLVTKNPTRSDEVRLVEVDFAQGRAVELGRLDLAKPTGTWLMAVSAAFDRVLVDYDWTVGGPHPGLTLHSEDGRRIATIPVRASRDAVFLSDGRIAIADRGNPFAFHDEGPGGLRLRVLTPDGRLLRDTTVSLSGLLAHHGSVRFNGEPSPGLVSVCMANWSGGRLVELETLFVDLESGEVRRREPGLDGAQYSYRQAYFANVPRPGSIATRLFRNADNDIMWFDPATGEKRLLIDIAAEKDESGSR